MWISTISRLEDEGNRICFEVHAEPESGKQRGSTAKVLLKEDFDMERNALDYLDHVDEIIAQDDGNPARELSMQAFRVLYPAFVRNVDYDLDVTPEGTETVDGRSCDRYRLSGESGSGSSSSAPGRPT